METGKCSPIFIIINLYLVAKLNVELFNRIKSIRIALAMAASKYARCRKHIFGFLRLNYVDGFFPLFNIIKNLREKFSLFLSLFLPLSPRVVLLNQSNSEMYVTMKTSFRGIQGMCVNAFCMGGTRNAASL